MFHSTLNRKIDFVFFAHFSTAMVNVAQIDSKTKFTTLTNPEGGIILTGDCDGMFIIENPQYSQRR